MPAGDLSLFADLGLEEMELGAVAADLDLYPEDAVAGIAERLRFGEAGEPALDRALGSWPAISPVFSPASSPRCGSRWPRRARPGRTTCPWARLSSTRRAPCSRGRAIAARRTAI